MDTSRVWVRVRVKIPMGYPCHTLAENARICNIYDVWPLWNSQIPRRSYVIAAFNVLHDDKASLRASATIIKICKTWLKMSNLTFLVRFLSVFYNFFLLNAIYLGYKIRLRSFARLRSVYVELCGSCVKMPVLHFRVCFLSDFFHFFFC